MLTLMEQLTSACSSSKGPDLDSKGRLNTIDSFVGDFILKPLREDDRIVWEQCF